MSTTITYSIEVFREERWVEVQHNIVNIDSARYLLHQINAGKEPRFGKGWNYRAVQVTTSREVADVS